MDLLDRYLNAVRLALIGRPRRDDIIAEMRDDLLSRIEAEESRLGRPLSETELEAVLKANGHPLIAAARFRERQYLIGPTILPFYEVAVATVLAMLLVISVIQVIASGQPLRALDHAIGDYIGAAIAMIGAATVIAVVLERFEVKLGFIENWRPRDLPAMAPARWGARPAIGGTRWRTGRVFRMAERPRAPGGFGLRPKNRWESLFELVVLLFFISWWTGLTPWPTTSVWVSDTVRISAGAVWAKLYWAVVIVAAVQAIAAGIRFVEPRRSRVGAAADLISAVAGIALAVALLADPTHIVQVDLLQASAEQMQKLYLTLHAVFRLSLVIAIAILTVQGAQAGWRMVARQEAGSGALE